MSSIPLTPLTSHRSTPPASNSELFKSLDIFFTTLDENSFKKLLCASQEAINSGESKILFTIANTLKEKKIPDFFMSFFGIQCSRSFLLQEKEDFSISILDITKPKGSISKHINKTLIQTINRLIDNRKFISAFNLIFNLSDDSASHACIKQAINSYLNYQKGNYENTLAFLKQKNSFLQPLFLELLAELFIEKNSSFSNRMPFNIEFLEAIVKKLIVLKKFEEALLIISKISSLKVIKDLMTDLIREYKKEHQPDDLKALESLQNILNKIFQKNNHPPYSIHDALFNKVTVAIESTSTYKEKKVKQVLGWIEDPSAPIDPIDDLFSAGDPFFIDEINLDSNYLKPAED